METLSIDLTKLVNANTDLISGRSFGEQEADKEQVLMHVKKQDKIIIKVDDKFVKAINDSFIKGFFSSVFSVLKTKERVKRQFEIQANEYFVRLFEKNWTILESLYADSTTVTNS